MVKMQIILSDHTWINSEVVLFCQNTSLLLP